MSEPARFAVFASGSGSNLQALLDREEEGAPYRVELVVTDRECGAEARARRKGRAVERVRFAGAGGSGDGDAVSMGNEATMPGGGAASTDDDDTTSSGDASVALAELLERRGVQGILLAGFLSLVPATVCRAYRGRALNVHPSLLPAFGGRGMYGARVHEAVLRSGASVSGPTVHYVNERYDDGRILAQWPVPVSPTDTPGSLAARVLEVEHILFPEAACALARFATGAAGAPEFRWPAGAAAAGLGAGTELGAGPEVRALARRAFGVGAASGGAPRALVSVSDKTGVADFAQALAGRGWEIVSTGGTARVLREAGVAVIEVERITGHPEMMEGRVKTLHPAVHAGILARRGHPDDSAEMARTGYPTVDLVAVNLYPFRETVAQPDATMERAMDNVDIGGPAMARAAAKNHRDVWAVVDPADYDAVLQALDARASGAAAEAARALRRRLAAKAFRHVSAYDHAVAAYLGPEERPPTAHVPPSSGLPPRIALRLRRQSALRYGENPDQAAAFYEPVARSPVAAPSAPAAAPSPAVPLSPDAPESPGGPVRPDSPTPAGMAALRQLRGKALSYNNILDLDGALTSLAPFAHADQAAACLVKHTTPCGLAVRPSLVEAFTRARDTDRASAFGSVIAFNRVVDAEAAAAVAAVFVECLVAPGFAADALEVLAKKKNLRLLAFPGTRSDAADHPGADPARDFLAGWASPEGGLALRSVHGGLLAQTVPPPPFHGRSDPDWTVASRRDPTAREALDLSFAWSAVYGVKSNAILLAREMATLGIGAGQTSRVDSSKIAVRKAKDAGFDEALAGAVLASDAFFPFRDGVDAAASAGVSAIVQPGGSVRDKEVVAAADEHGLAMVFTGRRLFRH